MADTDCYGARDMIGLTQQVKLMRDGMETAGHPPGLILLVVADGERKAVVDRIRAALEPSSMPSERPDTEAGR
jgi:hypothetical protein